MKNLFLACAVPMLGGCAAVIPALHSGAVALAAHASAAPIAAAAAAAGVGLGVGIVASDDIKRLAREAQDTQFGTQLAGTYGAMLQDAQTEVQSLVQTAMQQQREVLVVAGLQVQGAITRAQAAYRDKLSLKIERLGDPEKKFAADLDSVVADLKSAADSTQKAAGDRAQRIAAGLRLPAEAPQLASPGPIFLFSHLPSQRVTTRGRFPDSYAKPRVPELLIDGKSYKAFDYWTDSLRFSIPTAAFDVAEPQAIIWKKGELTVPWNSPGWNIGTSVELAKFGIVVGLLPHSFGSLNIQHKTFRLRQEETTRVSEDFQLDASERDVEENRCLTLTPEESADGWRIAPGSSALLPGTRNANVQSETAQTEKAQAEKAQPKTPSEKAPAAEGQNAEWKDLGMQSESERSVCRKALAIHRGAVDAESAGGKMIFRISARIRREVSEPMFTEESLYLDWGTRHTFKYASGSWKLRYARNGGGAKELESSDLSNPLIKVSADAASVTISVYPF